jgi:hypothetical protein
MAKRGVAASPYTRDESPIMFNIKGEDAAMFRQYVMENGHPSPASAMREILGIYFASLPLDGAVVAARDNALNSTKHWVMTRLNVFMTELQQELQAQIATIEKSGYGDKRP